MTTYMTRLKRSIWQTWSGLLCCIILPLSQASTAKLDVIYPTLQGGMSAHSFPLSVLHLALEKSGQAYSMQASSTRMTQGRAIIQLKSNQGVTVLWAGTSRQFEQTMQPIRIPIYMGLLGYRLFLINREQQPEFDSINDLQGLQAMIAGQGIGWSDSEILEASNLKVSNTLRQNLMVKLISREIDYFPLGITEIHSAYELNTQRHPSLAVERHLLLHYPFALFFFVHQDNQPLAQAIETGLKAAHQDGSYRKLFDQHPHIQTFLQKNELESRTHIHIPNPFLTDEASNIPPQYLYQME